MRPNPPQLRLLSNELIHQLPALCIIHHNDLDASCTQVRLAAEEILVLADDNTADAVEETGSGACAGCASVSIWLQSQGGGGLRGRGLRKERETKDRQKEL